MSNQIMILILKMEKNLNMKRVHNPLLNNKIIEIDVKFLFLILNIFYRANYVQ